MTDIFWTSVSISVMEPSSSAVFVMVLSWTITCILLTVIDTEIVVEPTSDCTNDRYSGGGVRVIIGENVPLAVNSHEWLKTRD